MATSAAAKDDDSPATRFAVDQLRSIIERIERLEEESILETYMQALGMV